MSVEGENEVMVASDSAELVENASQVEKEAETDSGEKSDESKPKKDGAQKRIDRLTREKYQLKAELDVIKRQLDGGQTRSNGVDRNQFESDQDYIEAVVEQRLAEKEARLEGERSAKKRDKIFAEAEKLGDFDREEFAEVTITPVMAEAIMESDVAAQLVLYLNNNPDEADDIAALPKARQAAAIGRIEARLEGDTKPAKAVSKSAAPEPIKPVADSKTSTGFRVGMSQAEYRALRAKQLSR